MHINVARWKYVCTYLFYLDSQHTDEFQSKKGSVKKRYEM